ncbi:MAG: hypothetical protein WC462_03105 [archaeon]
MGLDKDSKEEKKGFFASFFGGIFLLVKALALLLIGLIVLVILVGLLNSFFGNNEMPPVVKEANIIMVKEIDPNVEIFLSTTIPPKDLNKTTFVTGEAIYPQEEGLKKGDRFAFRVLDGNEVIIPLDIYPYFDVPSDGGAGTGTINNEGRNILPGGKYTLQLVKIDSNNTKATIVAEKEFEIIGRYSKEFLSRIEFWISKDNKEDSEKLQELDLSGIEQINFAVFGKAPEGEKEVYGRTVMVRENFEGEVLTETLPWEYSFMLYPGEPQKLTGLSGHPLPGTYHVKIYIDNELIKEYKIIV